MDNSSLVRLLFGLGIILILLGVVVKFAGQIPQIGRLPGDIVIRRGNFTLFLPIGTSIILSLLLSLILAWLRR